MTDEHPPPRGDSRTGQQGAGDKDQDHDAERAMAEAPVTGDARVDDAVAGLSRLRGRPAEEHVAVLEEVHGRLRDILDDLGPEHASAGGSGPAATGGKASRVVPPGGHSGYEWWPGREVTEIAPNAVRDHTGAWHHGDLVVLCPGAVFTGVGGRYHRSPPAPARSC